MNNYLGEIFLHEQIGGSFDVKVEKPTGIYSKTKASQLAKEAKNASLGKKKDNKAASENLQGHVLLTYKYSKVASANIEGKALLMDKGD